MNGKYSINPSKVDTLLEGFKPQLPMDCIGLISKFVGPQHTILLAQIQCAGTGLNLQHMDRVIFLSPWWTAALMDQAAGRVLRLGQKNPVDIHYVWLKEEMESSLNIDDYMNSRVEHKRKLCKQLLAAARG
jgi:superfamily II DNA or RNA helicase